MTLESSLEENQRHVTGIMTCDLGNQGRNETLAQIDSAIKFVTKGPGVCVSYIGIYYSGDLVPVHEDMGASSHLLTFE